VAASGGRDEFCEEFPVDGNRGLGEEEEGVEEEAEVGEVERAGWV